MQAIKLNHDTNSLQQLEFPRIIEKLRNLLSTPYGAEQLETLQFYDAVNQVREALTEVSEMLGLIESGHNVPIAGFSDIRPHLEKIKPENAYLDVEALLDVRNDLQLMGELTHFFREHKEEAPSVHQYANRIHYHRNIIKEIDATIDRTGEIFDNASRELRQIRIKIRSLESEQQQALRRVQKRYAEFSQDEIVTLRDGRMVLGILPSFVNRVNGIVHGTSSTGATIFVEPMETLKLGNQIQNLKIQERTEIIKILRFITGLIRQVRNDIHYGINNLAILDLIFAKARLAMELQATTPQIIDRPYIKISRGRHPLLILKMGYENVVPLSIQLGGNLSTALITGPNAGGKTVALKTIGLLILMTQMGMLIPADADSQIPLLSNILVDIGDRQSLEQDLSTFSAHIVRLGEILKNANENSLVLLDEVGTGTDPREGSALAIALLTQLTENRFLTVATTHHGELKAFAHRHPHVENASMEFDLETLQPVYRLRIGVPGSSYAIEIARRYGLPEDIIEQAREHIGREKDTLEDLILSLEQRIQKQDNESRELNIKLTEAEAMRNLYQRQLEQIKQHKSNLKQEAAEEAQQILQDANALIERSVREIRQSNASRSAIKSAREGVRRKKQEVKNILAEKTPKTEDTPALRKGDIVRIDSLGEEGEMLEDSVDKQKVRVLVGNIKMTLNPAGLRKLHKTSAQDRVIHHVSGSQVDDMKAGIGPELDLRGLDAEQAIEETDRYLDDVWESGWEEVRIVHGKGTGVLRKSINQFLSGDKRVAEKRLGKWGEGDTGVTVVKLNKSAK